MDIHIQPTPQLLLSSPPTHDPQREAELLHRHQLQEERRQQRLATIQQWHHRVESERLECRDWIQHPKERGPLQRPASLQPLEPRLGRQIRMLWESTRPTPNERRHRKKVLRDIQAFFDAHWPGRGLVVAPFGSSVTGMYNAHSDIDVCIIDPSRPLGVGQPAHTLDQADLGSTIGQLPEWYDVRLIARLMRKWAGRRWNRIIAIDAANVPIIKLEVGSLSVDVNINDRFGLINSYLIRAYAELRPSLFRPLCYAMKHWLNRRGLNDPGGKGGLPSLSSYSIVLLIIQSLQVSGDLPNLQHPGLVRQVELRDSYLWLPPKRPRRRSAPKWKATQNTATGPTPNTSAHQPTGTNQYAGPPPPPPARYNVTFFDPIARQAYIAQVESEGTRKWINTQYQGCDWSDPGSSGLHSIDPGQSHFRQQEAALEAAFKRFLLWYDDLTKRKMYVSVAHGTPQPLLSVDDDTIQRHAMGPDGMSTPDDTDGRVHHAATNLSLLTVTDCDRARAPTYPAEWLSSPLVIRDPFIHDRNTAKNIGEVMADRLKKEFGRAAEMLRDESAPLLLADLSIPLEYEEALRIEEQGEELSDDVPRSRHRKNRRAKGVPGQRGPAQSG